MPDTRATTANTETLTGSSIDTNSKRDRKARLTDRSSWFWLLLAAVLLVVADGRNTVAVAAWLAPVCLMRFMRMQTLSNAVSGAFAVRLITFMIAERGMIPIPGIFYYLFVILVPAIALLPYLTDRWLVRRLHPVIGTLVFPAATVALQFLMGFGLHGTWGSVAYTQAGDLPLLQLLAVTGLGGVTFVMMWFAPVANLLLEKGMSGKPGQRALGVFAACCISIFSLGGLRLALFPVLSPVVRVAALSPPADGPAISAALLDRVIHRKGNSLELTNSTQRPAQVRTLC